MSTTVQIVFCAVLIGDPGCYLDRIPPAVRNVGMRFDGSNAGWENQIELAVGASQLPFPQRIVDRRGHRDFPVTSLALRRAEFAPKVSPLFDVDHAALEIDSIPRQAADFRPAQPRECRHNDERTPTSFGSRENLCYFLF